MSVFSKEVIPLDGSENDDFSNFMKIREKTMVVGTMKTLFMFLNYIMVFGFNARNLQKMVSIYHGEFQ